LASIRGLFFPLFAAVSVLCANALAASPTHTADGFAVPQPGHVFEFSRDHGSHPDFKIEWWYLTGHLFAEDGRRFGYQATFFRNAANDRSAHLFLAHMAVLDVRGRKFLHQERLNREGWDAGAAVGTLALHNGPWSLKLVPADAAAGAEKLELRGGVRAEARFAFTLTPEKPLVIFGDDGVSRKGADPTAASYYLTWTRLRTEGDLVIGGETLRVRGQSWMDHEISSSQLGADQVGWDWVSVQFDDGRELMLYRLRRRDGSADPASTLTWVDQAGRAQKVAFTWEVLTRWRSEKTKAEYPARVRISAVDPATGREVSFELEPLYPEQELTGSVAGIPYWEGACRVRDAHGREIGSAFMELTGYAQDLVIR
jgi:predicted secreted hydrolase